MRTNFETLIALAGYTLNHLFEHQIVTFEAEKRTDLIDAMATEYGVSFAHDEDIIEQAIEEVEEKLGEGVLDGDITETEVFNHARKEIIKSFNGETISGLYLVESLNQVAHRINSFLLNSDLVEDVYVSDDELVEFLIPRIRSFSVKRA